jgi:glycosyltransferase involved in cell wall biosynthesis
MKSIVQAFNESSYPFDPLRTFNFDLSDTENYNLIYGFSNMNGRAKENYINIVLEFEEPNFIPLRNLNTCLEHTKKFQKKFTLCPYTAKLYNSLLGKNIVSNCFFPTNIEYIKKNIGEVGEKDINVVYVGHNVSPRVNEFIKRSHKFDAPGYLDKMKLLYRTKILICHNLLFYDNNNDFSYLYDELVKIFPEFKSNDRVVPQLKSRIFEAGFSKCIPLVYYDKFKVVEEYFVPGQDFIYFHDSKELDELIEKILNNYDDYKHIAENIYKKCMENYTTKCFIDRYIKSAKN